MTAVREHSSVDEVRDALEYCYAQGWTDGLPVVPCTERLLAEFLATTDRGPDDVLLTMPHLGRSCTVRLAALNAAMAGCRPEYFPTVVAAWRSMTTEGYANGVMQSTTGTAPLIIVNGDVRAEIGINSAGNVFGPGFRANATIGRAVRLGILNVFGVRPHALDQSTQGTPAKYTSCIGENQEASPWPAFHEAHGFASAASAVTVLTMRSAAHIEARHTTDAEQLLRDIAGTVARTGAMMFRTSSSCLVLCPEHASLLAGQGWDRAGIGEFLFAEARVTQQQLDAVGKGGISRQQHWRLPRGHSDAIVDDQIGADGNLHALTSPTAVQIVVAGAANAGVSTVVDIFDLIGGAPSIVPVETAGRRFEDGPGTRLDEVVALLARDGFTAAWDLDPDGGVTVRIGAGSADCAECLAPEPVLTAIVSKALSASRFHLKRLDLPAH
ncbi:hypothetical protein [Pseudonocardia sp. GCM10023141]|uniref:hypothetical protein n=1 Tax=Pseudonocardia sp. GCM10023141 TaxID=3252653 RepID=UPI003611583C